MDKNERKVKNFMFTTATISLIASSYNLINNDYISSIGYFGLANGLYQTGKSIKAEKNEYIDNLKLYEGATKSAAISCILIPDSPYELNEILIYSFIGINLYLLSKEFQKENRQK